MLLLSRTKLLDVKSVYCMSPVELRNAFRKASDGKESSAKYWDALMYRGSVVKSELSMNDVSIILDSLYRYKRFSSAPFARYLLDPIPIKGRSANDAAMILRTIKQLVPDDQNLEKELIRVISDKVSNIIRVEDLGEVSRILSRCSPQNVTSSIKSRIESLITNQDLHKVRDPKTVLSFLNFMIVDPSKENFSCDDEEPFFTTNSNMASSISTELVSRVLSRVITLSPIFNAKDVVDFALCIETLVLGGYMHSLGHPTLGPIFGLISRQTERNLRLFKPDALVTLLNISLDIDKSKLENESKYRIREFNCKNCVKLLSRKNLNQFIFARLHKFDACSSLTPKDLVKIGETVISDQTDIGVSLMKSLVPVAKKAGEQEASALVSIYKSLNILGDLEKIFKPIVHS